MERFYIEWIDKVYGYLYLFSYNPPPYQATVALLDVIKHMLYSVLFCFAEQSEQLRDRFKKRSSTIDPLD